MSKKRKIQSALKITGVLLLLAVVAGLFSFVHSSRNDVQCWKIDIDVDREDGYYFVNEEDILQAIQFSGDSLLNVPVHEIDVEKIQHQVKLVPGIRNADVYTTVDGRLCVKVRQCQPLVRIMNRDGSGFYLDKDGGSIPLSTRFTARVPIVLGNIQEPEGLGVHAIRANEELRDNSLLDDIYDLLAFVAEDELLNAQLDHIEVDPFREFIIIPRVGNHRIYLGEATELDKKFKKLRAFYKQNISSRDLNKYTTLDLRYKDQVVCRKRNY